MAHSTLQHDEDTPPVVTRGHGAAALGPSDSSDTGSDVQGATGIAEGDLAFSQASDDGDEMGAPGVEVDAPIADVEQEAAVDEDLETPSTDLDDHSSREEI